MSYTTSFEFIQTSTLSRECGTAEATIETLQRALMELANVIDDLYDEYADVETRMAAISYEVAMESVKNYKQRKSELQNERDSFLKFLDEQ